MKNSTVYIIFLLLVFAGIIIGILQSAPVSERINELYYKMQQAAAEGHSVQEYLYPVLAISVFSIILLAVIFFIFIPHHHAGLFFSFIFLVILSAATLAVLSEVYKDEIANYLKAGYVPKQSVSEKTK